MRKYKSKKSIRKKKNNKNNRTKKYYRKKGGHPNEDLPHYHLYIKLPSGSTREMIETFERSDLSKNIDAGTIGSIQEFVKELLLQQGITKPFTLFWKGKKLVDTNIKLRQIVVDKTKLPLYKYNVEHPIVVVYNEDIGDPIYFEAHDLDLEDFNAPQTPR